MRGKKVFGESQPKKRSFVIGVAFLKMQASLSTLAYM